MGETISEHVTQCLNRFRDLLTPSNASELELQAPGVTDQIAYAQDRFKDVWVNYFGANGTGARSLDDLVRDFPNKRFRVIGAIKLVT